MEAMTAHMKTSMNPINLHETSFENNLCSYCCVESAFVRVSKITPDTDYRVRFRMNQCFIHNTIGEKNSYENPQAYP